MSVANGLTTPMCTWATSKPPAGSRRRTSGGASGLTGSSHGSRSAIRWTRTPSTSSTNAVPLAVAARGRGEHLDLVAAGAQLRGQVVDLHLDAAQPGQVAVRQQGHLHGPEPAMRQDGR